MAEESYCKLVSYVPTYENEFFIYHFEKWFVEQFALCIRAWHTLISKHSLISHQGTKVLENLHGVVLYPPELSELLWRKILVMIKEPVFNCVEIFLYNLDELADFQKKGM